MTNLLPTPGADLGVWGGLVNAFLLVAHNDDGTLNSTEPWLIYSGGTPAAGTLSYSIAAANGTDTEGNVYLEGFCSYQIVSGLYTVTQVYNGTVSFGYASGYAGPWTIDAVVSDPGGNDFQVNAVAEGCYFSFGTGQITIGSATAANGTNLFFPHNGMIYSNQPGHSGVLETWHSATLLNGWTDNSSGQKVAYRRVASPPNTVQMFCNLAPGTYTDGTIIATVSGSYTPLTNKWFAAYSGGESGTESAGVEIDTNGNITCHGVTSSSTRFGFVADYPLDF